jgi:hypothetical protein
MLQGVPAIAVSLDNYKALTPDGFKAGAAYIVAFVQASHLWPYAVACSCHLFTLCCPSMVPGYEKDLI